MRRYKLTGRGWALAFVVAALLFVGTYALVSFAFGGEPPENGPSNDPGLSMPEATKPGVPSVTDDPTPEDPTPVEPTPEEPSPSPEQPSPSLEPTPSPTPVPSPSPVPPPSAKPAEPLPSPSEPPPEEPSPAKPAASPTEPAWANDKTSVMFAFNSAEMLEPEHYIADLTEFLPPLDELDGYLVVVTAYTASGETAEDLAELRTEAVYEMLIDLGLPGSKIRLVADPVSGGSEPYRQRADVYFIYVGNK